LRWKRGLSVAVALCLSSLGAAAQEGVALALSGGGARGAAHIGVLKVLDELRIPVRCIAGTSMGAVVGGAFAAGNDPHQMERLVRETEWNRVFDDQPPRAELSARRKADDYKSLFRAEFGLRDGELLLPAGVLAGISIEGFLRRLALPAGEVDDFDRLPIPYRAVAADIATGQPVTLRSGSLIQSMRASMAVPVALTPIDIDGRLLVDGGIADNLPIDTVRRLCGGPVIAVNVGTPPLERASITSAFAVVGQLVALLGQESVQRQLKSLTPQDLLVEPDLGDIAATDFERQVQAIAIGEAAARAMVPALARYSVPPERYAQMRAAQRRDAPELGTVAAITFEGTRRTNPSVLARTIESRPGEPLDSDVLEADLRRLYGLGEFDKVDYRIDRTSGRPTLVFPVQERSVGPDYVRFGLGFASDFDTRSTFNALLSLRRTWLNRAGGEWLAEVQVGRNTFLSTEFHQPIDGARRYFVAPYAKAQRYAHDVYVQGTRISSYAVTDRLAGVDFGVTLGTWGEARLGPVYRGSRAQLQIGEPLIGDQWLTTAGLSLRVSADRLDAAWFPREGSRTLLSALVAREAWGSDRSFERVEASWTGSHSIGAHTVTATAYAGTDLGSRSPTGETFTLGGPQRLSGYRINEFSGRRAALVTLRYYRRLVALPSLLGAGLYGGASIEAGEVEAGSQFATGTDGVLWSGSLFVAAESAFGPAYVGFGLAPGGTLRAYLLLGAP
jgi:NTE family protein